MNKSGKVTINDIAAAAGVSKTTVSRFLNGRKDLMSEKTSERIAQVIERYEYRPSEIARNLKKETTNLVGVLIADITSPFSTALICGIEEYLTTQGFTTLFMNSRDNLDREMANIESLKTKGVSGLIINTTSYNNNYLIKTVNSGIPIVLSDRYVKGYPFDIVTNDHVAGIDALVRHLKVQGFNRPVMFTQEWINNSPRMLRREAFIKAVENHYGYDPQADIYVVDYDDQTLEDLVSQVFLRIKPEDVPVIFCVNSVTTIRVFKVLKQRGYDIPRQVGICGPEDWDWQNELNWPALITPAVTTTAIHSTRLGRKSAELLVRRMKEPGLPQQEILLPYELRVRASTRLG